MVVSTLGRNSGRTSSVSVGNGVVIIALTELTGEGDAGEILQPVPLDGVDVEPDDE